MNCSRKGYVSNIEPHVNILCILDDLLSLTNLSVSSYKSRKKTILYVDMIWILI